MSDQSPSPALENEAGLRAAYAVHGDELYRMACRTLGDRGQAEEAVQETFLRAWRAADRYDPEISSLRGRSTISGILYAKGDDSSTCIASESYQ